MKKAEVGLITFHFANNFGAVLQAYTLQQTLNSLKVNNQIIDLRPYGIVKGYYIFPKLMLEIKNFGLANGLLNSIIKLTRLRYYSIKSSIKFGKFRNKNLEVTKKRFHGKVGLESTLNLFEIIIVGSDQVWNPSITKNYQSIYFLKSNNSSLKKYSYAASFGNKSNIIENYPFIDYLKDFNEISLRESSATGYLINQNCLQKKNIHT